MKHNINFSICLKPHGTIKPVVEYGIDNKVIANIELDKFVTINIDTELDNSAHVFFINFKNKTNETPDMAVEIESVTFEGMTLDRFKWSSRYYPEYPEPWASQQTEPLPEYHSSATYLGWNGQWRLMFDTPIFTWIHKLENLGWIYD